MGNLTKRTLRVHAVLEECRNGSKDILEALLPFFQPIVANYSGQLLDARSIATEVRQTYGWNFSDDIVEELAPRFADAGWLERVDAGKNSSAYRVRQINSQDQEEFTSDLSIQLDQLMSEFQAFMRTFSPLTEYTKSSEEFAETLISWLVSIDAYNEQSLQKAALLKQTEGRVTIFQELPPGNDLSSEDNFICARFVEHLISSGSNLTSALCDIASAGLIADVIQDFRKPVTHVDRSDLVIFLDSSIALEALGVSGRNAAENVRSILDGARAIGCSVRVFSDTLEEMKRALNAVLDRHPSDRTGPTADAIRRQETEEAYARAVASHPEQYLKEFKIQIVYRALDQFPNEHQFFPAEKIEDCISQISWHLEMGPREHDAVVLAFVQRMRQTKQNADLFSTKFVFVTRNGLLSQMAKKYCRDEGITRRDAVPPIIHHRQLATAIWLRTGSGMASEAIPKSILLVACEKVLSLKRSVLEKAKSVGKTLTEDKAQQLDLLLTQDRSVQVLQDRTLGTSRLLGPQNIDVLMEEMKNSLVERERKDFEIRLREERKKSSSDIKREKQLAAEKALEAQQAAQLAASMKGSEDQYFRALVSNADKSARRTRYTLFSVIHVLMLAVIAIPLLPSTGLTSPQKAVLLALPVLLSFFLASAQVFAWKIRMSKIYEWHARRILKIKAEKINMAHLLETKKIEWEDRKFRLEVKPIENEAESSDDGNIGLL